MDYYDIEQLSTDDFNYLVSVYDDYSWGYINRENAYYAMAAFDIDFDVFEEYYHAFVE